MLFFQPNFDQKWKVCIIHLVQNFNQFFSECASEYHGSKTVNIVCYAFTIYFVKNADS